MRVITNYKSLSEKDQGATIAIGNFDGIHLGHQSVIALARESVSDAPLGVLTFDPHPGEFFNPKQLNFKLMTAETKQNRLEKIGVEFLYQLKFSKNLAALSARDFTTKVIVGGLKAVSVVVGSDFRFGKGRSGDAETLKELGKELGFKVKIAEILLGEGGQLSSTRIRKLLSDGFPRAAAKMLGHWHRIDGLVIQGDQRGRTLGYPTANLSIDGLHPPKFGIYATLIDILTGPYKGTYQGATSIGKKPMFGENIPNCETYILNFEGNLYGETLSIALVEFIRPEMKFNELELLINQMEADCIDISSLLDSL